MLIGRHRVDVYCLPGDPALLNQIADTLTGAKAAKPHSIQRELAEKQLRTVMATDHAFFLPSVNVPDESFLRYSSLLEPDNPQVREGINSISIR